MYKVARGDEWSGQDQAVLQSHGRDRDGALMSMARCQHMEMKTATRASSASSSAQPGAEAVMGSATEPRGSHQEQGVLILPPATTGSVTKGYQVSLLHKVLFTCPVPLSVPIERGNQDICYFNHNQI